jgi:hypothetical protein
VLVSATVNSAGNGGVGDVIANLFSVTTAYGQSGHADITCMNSPAPNSSATPRSCSPTANSTPKPPSL